MWQKRERMLLPDEIKPYLQAGCQKSASSLYQGLPVLILRFSQMFVSDTGCHEEERKQKEYHHKYGWG